MKTGRAFMIVGLVLLAGCVQCPMGLSAKQWQSLTPAQQADYQAKQYQIDGERQRHAEEQQAAQARAAVEAAESQRARIASAYASARYGDIITVTIRGGTIAYGKQRYPCEPVGFDIVRGEAKEIEFRGAVDQHGITKAIVTRCKVRLSDDASTFYFNDGSARRIVLTNDGSWERGAAYPMAGRGISNDLGVNLADMTMTLRYRGLDGVPKRIILEHR
jgi:outer membrane murein-binding lipoprotein Lpp